ncbi:hypothetical protein A1O3_02802 [Capronia epimyces CBS 606.96]|uniref:C3H1-type domain-containing protein n=1 Tax=Capronia epimyces CBS 606.96 TaxID=1182542 RepID=W9YJ69_9EURO|nr:uncharacterized protein A1O3_02802 [Capronia epimyces CBS 606.96]EXJ89735.1 hypothetical protein A1O3_02802 [Capronia epimyces CBS 606.96]
MDSSGNASMNGSQSANNPSYSFLDGIQSFAASDPLQNGGEDYSQYFDPALFESTTIGHGFSQQPQQPMPPNFNSNVAKQSNSSGLPQYNSPQPNYGLNQYPPALYDSRQIPQQNYDSRFFPRPSASPVGFDGGYPYQQHMPFTGQNYGAQHVNMPQRQSPSPAPPYPARQPQSSPYMNAGPRPSQLSQVQVWTNLAKGLKPPLTWEQSSEMMHYPNFQEQTHQPSNTYVDPSLLTANQINSTNNTIPQFQSHQSFIAPSYFKPGSTVDPRSLQPVQPASSQIPQTAPAIQIKPEKVSKPRTPKDPHAPKKLKSITKNDGTVGSVSEPESESDSELVIEDQESPEITPALLTVSKPTDDRGRALYEAVQAVWSPRNKPAPAEKIRTAIAAFGDTVRNLRDAWKAKNDSLRKSEIPGSPTASQAAQLKDAVSRYRHVMESVMARSLLYGHPAIVKRLGDNPITMSALYSFMLDRFNAGDYDSPLVGAILKFVVEFKTLDTEMLEMTKLSKILQRLTKKATTDIKSMSQAILDNAATASAAKAAKGTHSKPEKPASPGAADGTRKDAVTGMKRAREGDLASQPAPKKIVKVIPASSKPLALQNAERRKALDAAQASKGSDKAATAAAPPNAGAKAKVAVTAPPKSAVFSSLMSASKRPGTSIAARAAAAAANKEKTPMDTVPASNPTLARKESPTRNGGPVPVAKTTSSFLGLLADMEKKPEKEVKKETENPNETEEEKTKRLRKEARRKLRVSWKADGELVETRLFTHDPEEEVGQGDSLRRDAGDTGREGEALKMHKDMDDLEEDEDEDSFDDFEPYTPPPEVDFSVLKDEADSLTINSIKNGGGMKPESPSSEAQNKHEQDTVMTIYTSKADRPPTPKEPDDSMDDFEPAEPETPFGEPTEVTRQREEEYRARLARNQPSLNLVPSRTDLAAQIQAISMGQAPPQQSGIISTELQRALGMLGQPAQGTPPPQAGPTPNLNLQALLQTVQQVTQNLQGQNQQPQYSTPAQTPAPTTNLSALLASMQQTSQGQTPALPLGLGGSVNPYPGSTDESSRKHGRADSNDYDNDGSRKGGNKKKKAGWGGDQAKPYNYKTQPCSFWEQGKCIKGDSCTYRHGDEEM